MAASRARARKILETADGSQTILGNKVEDVAVAAGDQLHFITWGGGGWGDPLARDPGLVAKEVRQGLVTIEGARRYGVVIANSMPDEDATRALRQSMGAARQSVLPLFDFGPTIDDLRGRCQAETGLPAPRAPEWSQSAAA